MNRCAMCEEEYSAYIMQVVVVESFQNESETHRFCSSTCVKEWFS